MIPTSYGQMSLGELIDDHKRLLAENAELKRRIEEMFTKTKIKHDEAETMLLYVADTHYEAQRDAYCQVLDWLNEILRPEEP